MTVAKNRPQMDHTKAEVKEEREIEREREREREREKLAKTRNDAKVRA